MNQKPVEGRQKAMSALPSPLKSPGAIASAVDAEKAPRFKSLTAKGTVNFAVLSPDGKFIACGYFSDGKTKLAIVLVAGGAADIKLFDVPSTYNFTNSIRWSPDGRFIGYRDWANGVWAQPVAGGKPELLEGLPAEKFYTFNWSPGGKQFAFTRGREVRDGVLITDF